MSSRLVLRFRFAGGRGCGSRILRRVSRRAGVLPGGGDRLAADGIHHHLRVDGLGRHLRQGGGGVADQPGAGVQGDRGAGGGCRRWGGGGGRGVEYGGVGVLKGVADRGLAADGPSHGGKGLLEVRVPANQPSGGAGDAAHRLRKQQLHCHQQHKDHAADHQAQSGAALPAGAAAAAGAAAHLLGPAAGGMDSVQYDPSFCTG